jgi:hypothetical protein
LVGKGTFIACNNKKVFNIGEYRQYRPILPDIDTDFQAIDISVPVISKSYRYRLIQIQNICFFAIASVNDGLPDDPTLEQALLQPDAELWRGARNEEMQSLIKLGVVDVFDEPDAVELLKTKWVLKRKRTKEVLIERYKARLVAKGFTHRKSINFHEVFASVVKHTTVRAMLAFAAV